MQNIQQIKEELKNIVKDKTSDNEVEMRFGQFKGNFVPGIGLNSFEESIKFLNSFAKFIKIEYSSIEYYNSYKKYVILEGFDINTKTDNVFYIEKKNIKNFDIKDYNIRISYNKEKKITPTEGGIPELFLIRKRFTYSYKNLIFDISMFVKDKKPITSLNKLNFDLEIELESTANTDVNLIFDLAWEFLKIIQQTHVPLRESVKDDIKNIYFKFTKQKKFAGSQPKTISADKIKGNYALTLKLNGKRALLMNINNEFFEISTKMDIKFTNLVQKTENKSLSILDCEYFKGKYHVFDIIVYEGNDVREQKFKTRMQLIDTLVKKISLEKIIKKEYITDGNLYENSVKSYKKYFTKKNDNLDGFIYTPIDDNSAPLKWKPEYYNTIDFKIKKIGDCKWELLCYDNNENEVPFHIEDYLGIHVTKVSQQEDESYTDGCVAEFTYNKEEEKFVPIKIRHDKLKGNYIGIAQDNFKSIMYPFNFEDLKLQTKNKPDKTLFNGRRFNNYVKRKLLMSNSKNVYTLLDLACGKGGDMHKWVDSNITFVKGYDIDTDSIKEANNRYNNSIKEDNTTKNYKFTFEYSDLSYETLQPNLENFIKENNSSYNCNGRFDLATCFFAIHYFFKDERSLNTFISNLTENLKDGGIFIMTTFDEKILQTHNYNIDTPLLKITKKNDLQQGTVYGRSIEVWIKDTVLNVPTEEYIVNFEFLIKKMEQNGFKLVKTGLHDEFYNEWKTKRNSLNDIEKLMCFLNRYAIFRYCCGSNNENVEEILNFEDFTIEEKNEPQSSKPKEPLPTKQSLQNKKVKELKEICAELEISASGKKDIIIKRILLQLQTNNKNK